MNDLDGLKHMGVFSNSAPLAVTPDQLQVMAANTSESTIRLRAQMTPRTFEVSNNGFDGWFPEWLVEKVAGCKEDITVVLDVSSSFAQVRTGQLDELAQAASLCILAPAMVRYMHVL